MNLAWLLDLWVAAAGLVAGSYLNVVIHRLPRRISTVLPRSRCPHCGAPIHPWDNVPLISFLLLRGRCRHCRAPIPWRYPLVEAATAALFVGCLMRFGPTPRALVAAAFGCLLIALAGIDLEHYLLPDGITLPGLAAGLAIAWFAPWIDFGSAALGALLGGGGLWLVAELWVLLRHEEGMGLGDAKMLAMVGAFLGWKGVLVTLLLGSAAGSLVGLAGVASGRLGMKARLPFGVFLALAALAALFVGEPLADAYGRLL
ncbi:MAG TPA: prepilin peptidase [Thermoanaerobaculia bacterium]|nr:prepilin peptidase [Thermoanaerobaculia bacterium]